MAEGEKSKSIQAIELARAVFEAIYGSGFGLIRFSVKSLTPTNGTNGADSKKWQMNCSFYETPNSTNPSNYQADINLEDNSVTILRLDPEIKESPKRYTVTQE